MIKPQPGQKYYSHTGSEVEILTQEDVVIYQYTGSGGRSPHTTRAPYRQFP